MKKNILFIINGMGCGGSQRNVSILANHFIEKHNVYIVCLFDDCVPFYPLNNKIKIIYLTKQNKNRISNLKYWIKSINEFIKSNNIDILISIGIRFGILDSFALKGVKNIKHIVRGTKNIKLNPLDRCLLKLKKRKISLIVSQTKTQSFIYPKSLRNRIFIIPNPFVTYESNKNISGFESKRFICVGRFYLEQKHQDLLIKELIPFFKRHPDYTLDLYGEPNIDDNGRTLEKLRFLIETNSLESNVHIKGTTKDIFNAIIPSFSFLCFSSIEGMPNALIESMSLGIVPVSTNWPGCEELLTNNKTGVILENPSDLSKRLESLITNFDEYKKISDSCYKFVKDNYSIEKVLSIWDSLID